MKIWKLIVLIFLVRNVQSSQGRYCAICNNHTLCKYSVGGPSAECMNYDKAVLLTSEDTNDIVNRVNERRHQVAMGLLHPFPQAANMKKMRWSSKLAVSAQRWADQCDQSFRPDREDDCRDLVSMKVGQNIATVVGASPGISVKSFVDTWFMLNMQFQGSVTYYNQSKDSKTKYFTQLIWADSVLVGCGRAKFLVAKLNKVVERLVCNFAPQGNLNGKPTYTIGYPGTQCPDQMTADVEFPGLCLQNREVGLQNEPVSMSQGSSTSLLRILNLANLSLEQELDPNNLNQTNLNSIEIIDQRHQKSRQVYYNNTSGAVKRDSQHIQNPMNYNEQHYNSQRQFTPERGHSRMYHGHPTSKEPVFNHDHIHTENNFRRIDYSTQSPYYSSSVSLGIIGGRRNYGGGSEGSKGFADSMNGRKVFGDSTDARKVSVDSVDGRRIFGDSMDGRRQFVDIGCTRIAKGYFANLPRRPPSPWQYCPCNQPPPPMMMPLPLPPPPALPPPPPLPPPPMPMPIPIPIPPPIHVCNRNCLPVPTMCPYSLPAYPPPPYAPPPFTPYCPYRKAGGDELNKSGPSQYENYDVFHNVEIKSGEDDTPRKRGRFESTNPDKLDNTEHRKQSDLYKQVKLYVDESRPKLKQLPASYRSFDYSERRKRGLEDQTFKPFWQMDEYNHKRPSELKAIRYTTLSNIKYNKKTRRLETTQKLPTSTETITIKPKDKSNKVFKGGRVTEKYLSFDELMHLRKLSSAQPTYTASTEYQARRGGHEETLDPRLETTITANTPYIRMRQCTRKLTCTWTAAAFFNGSGPGGAWGSGGGGGGGGGGGAGGSRTPPGYVEGCTRTSTCTRDYMDRNKAATPSEGPDGAAGSTTLDDEDYCERRSLNIRRRNLDERKIPVLNIGYQEMFTEPTTSTTDLDEDGDAENSEETSTQSDFHCICYDDDTRLKRRDLASSKIGQLINKDRCCNNKKVCDCSTYSSRSKNGPILSHCPCNGTKSLRNMFYRAITLKYYVAWLCYHMFIMRTFEG